MTAPRLTSHVSRFTLLLVLLQFSAPAAAQGRGGAIGITTRISVASDGTQGNSSSHYPSISADGRYVTYYSHADNLVSGDTNDYEDVFVYDRLTAQTTRVSLASDGTQGNGPSVAPSISANGRYVSFWSDASNLVAGDTNGTGDVFVHDRVTGQTTRVSVTSSGTEGNGGSYYPLMSADGRLVAFQSDANNLVSGDTNGRRDAFLYDRATGQTTRISVASDGTEGDGRSYATSISVTGRYVGFSSFAKNLVAGDTNAHRDAFLHDRATAMTTRVSVDSSGLQGNSHSYGPRISANGRYVAFESYASNLVPDDTNGNADVFVHERLGAGP